MLVRNTHKVGQTVKFNLLQRTIVYYNGIIQIATFYEVGLYQRLHLAYKHKCTAGTYFAGKIGKVAKRGILIRQYRRIKRYHGVYAEIIVGQNYYRRTCFLVTYLYFRTYNIEILVHVLLLDSYLLYFFAIFICASIQNGNFRSVYLYKAVVYTESIKSRKGVLDGAYTYFAFFHNSASLCRCHVFCNGINYGLAFQVYTLYSVTMVFRRGTKLRFNDQTGVKSFPFNLECLGKCTLFHICRIGFYFYKYIIFLI